jgi:hypothetical protein
LTISGDTPDFGKKCGKSQGAGLAFKEVKFTSEPNIAFFKYLHISSLGLPTLDSVDSYKYLGVHF